MAISSALSLALNGLQLNQRQSELTAQNIAHKDQAGYTKKQLTIGEYLADSMPVGFRTQVDRIVDQEVQRQIVNANPTTGFTDVQARFADRLDRLMGNPGEDNSLSSTVAAMSKSLQLLGTTPGGLTERMGAVSAAKTLALKLNQASEDVQAMRLDAETGLADAVTRVNSLGNDILTYNDKIVAGKSAGQDITGLEDARDKAVNELSGLIDIQTRTDRTGRMQVSTGSGMVFVEMSVNTLKFDRVGTMTPYQAWDADPTKRGVGTITAGTPPTDLIATGTLKSGRIAALVDARDRMLVQAQTQLDNLAASLSRAFSDDTVQGTAATSGAQAGFDIDLTALKSGNPVTLQYVDTATGKTKTVNLFRVDDPATLPLADSLTADPNDKVYGIDFSAGMASVATQIGTALGAAFTVSNPSGSTIRVLDDGAAGTVDIASLSATVTRTATKDTGKALAVFTDGGSTPFTGALDGTPQTTGFSARIAVNDAVLADPTLMVKYSTSPATEEGDSARPNDLLTRLKTARFGFGPETGLVSGQTSLTTTVSGLSDAMIAHWGSVSADAAAAKDSQAVIQNNLDARFSEASSVNMDEELGRLTEIQAAYSANARVLTVVRDMLDALMNSVR